MNTHCNITLSIEVQYEKNNDAQPIPDTFVVAYDDKDQQLAFARIKSRCAQLKLPEFVRGKRIRIFHASTEFGLEKESSIARLKRYKSIEKAFFVNPNMTDLRLVLPKFDLTHWLKTCCRVRGQVSAKIFMPNGKTRLAPLCNARLQIFEIDHTFALMINALPDHLVYRLRDEWQLAIQSSVAITDNRPEIAVIGEGLRQALTPVAVKQDVQIKTELRQQIEPVFKLNTAASLRKAFVSNQVFLRPYFCFFDWLPSHNLDLLKTIDIKADGSFDTHINYPCYGDKPDLYFKVQQDCHEDGWLTVYQPSIHCNTYWNYCCGTKINILVSHPKTATGLSIPPCDFSKKTNEPTFIGAVDDVDSVDMPFVIANAALLHTGKVLFLPAANIKRSTVWTPSEGTAGTFEDPSPEVDEQLWCSGHAFLADGRLLVMGGAGGGPSQAVDRAWTFDPHSEKWKQVASMENKRWYPTGVTLPDGRVLAFSGWDFTHGTLQNIDTVEIYNPTNDEWDDVSGAERVLDGTYPGLHLLPSGDIIFTRTGFSEYLASPTDKSANLKLTEVGAGMSGDWEDEYVMNCPSRQEGMSVMLFREHTETRVDQNNFEAFALDEPIPFVRILVIGGGEPPSNGCSTKSVEMIDLPASSGTPQWKKAADMNHGRINVNVVLLPDDTVLACGGAVAGTPSEIYHPDENVWIDVAPLKLARGYHSTALLLPNAKVLVADWSSGKMELYSPPYLFRGPRPSYTVVEHHIHHDAKFSIHSPDACRIKKIGFMRPSAVTHQTDPEQRYVPLKFERSGKCELIIQAPKNGAIAPPGYYMLFIVDDCGIPSEASFIQIH